MRWLWTGLIDLLSIAVGVATGLWTSGLTRVGCPGGPYSSCIAFATSDFAGWESALIGLGATVAILSVSVIASDVFRAQHFSWAHWLGEDIGPK